MSNTSKNSDQNESADKNFNFKAAFEELEEINTWFRGDNFDLDEALVRFRTGAGIIKQAKERLQKVENEFKQIQADLEEGE
jgi:exodeoxyribonuclease VII small subunit